jgi:hypothetical protein
MPKHHVTPKYIAVLIYSCAFTCIVATISNILYADGIALNQEAFDTVSAIMLITYMAVANDMSLMEIIEGTPATPLAIVRTSIASSDSVFTHDISL